MPPFFLTERVDHNQRGGRMSAESVVLESIAKTISGYRAGDIELPDAGQVDRWARQFTAETRLDFLREFDHVLKSCFFTRESVSAFLDQLSINEELTGGDPKQFWSAANVLRIQQNGQSQREMVRVLKEQVERRHGVKLQRNTDESEAHVYIDDFIFSGNRARSDLTKWIRTDAPKNIRLHVVVIAYYRLGQFYLERDLKNAAQDSGKALHVKYWRTAELENRLTYKESSQVLWPTRAPSTPEVSAFTQRASKFPLNPRLPGATVFPFSSEAGRALLETEFFAAGARIIARIENWKPMMRPLGFSPFGAGFGSTLVTYRNCPNNCPLALWWGDRTATSGALHWFPLLPREGYSSAKNVFGPLDDDD